MTYLSRNHYFFFYFYANKFKYDSEKKKSENYLIFYNFLLFINVYQHQQKMKILLQFHKKINSIIITESSKER